MNAIKIIPSQKRIKVLGYQTLEASVHEQTPLKRNKSRIFILIYLNYVTSWMEQKSVDRK